MRKRVEEKIRSVVERMDKLTYVYEDLQGANLKMDSAELPVFVNVMPLSGNVRVTPTQVKHYPKCSFWFVDKIDLDADNETIKDVVDRCMDYAYEFILTLNDSKLFEPIENVDVPLQVVTSDLDANVSGVVLEIELKERQGLMLCHGKKPHEYFDDGHQEDCR